MCHCLNLCADLRAQSHCTCAGNVQGFAFVVCSRLCVCVPLPQLLACFCFSWRPCKARKRVIGKINSCYCIRNTAHSLLCFFVVFRLSDHLHNLSIYALLLFMGFPEKTGMTLRFLFSDAVFCSRPLYYQSRYLDNIFGLLGAVWIPAQTVINGI